MGSKSTSTQYRKRDPEPDELKNLRQGLYNALYPGLQSFSSENLNTAQGITNNALNQMSSLMGNIPNYLNQSNSLLQGMSSMLSSGELPSGITDKLNAGVTKNLQDSMGSMLNNLSSRGVLNSSITSQGTSRLGQQAANAFNNNYLNAFNSVMNGYSQGLQGAQGNTNSLLNSINALGQIPSQAYQGAYAGITPAYNLWKDWQNSYDSREDYDTVVGQKSSGCITGETLVTLEDGRDIPVQELKENDKILSWDFDKGEVFASPLTAFFKNEQDEEADIIKIIFDDGSDVGVVFEHLFFDLTQGKFVAVNYKNLDFIGHYFAKVNHDGNIIPVEVKNIFFDGKTKFTFAPQTENYLNFLAAGFISGNDGQLGLCNRFDFDVENIIYDPEKKQADLNKYGKLNYEELKNIISEEFFFKNRCDEFSVAFAKGLITLNHFKAYLKHFSHCFLL